MNNFDIEEKAWYYKKMPNVVNEKGLTFKMYCEFLSGAIWMRDLIKEQNK